MYTSFLKLLVSQKLSSHSIACACVRVCFLMTSYKTQHVLWRHNFWWRHICAKFRWSLACRGGRQFRKSGSWTPSWSRCPPPPGAFPRYLAEIRGSMAHMIWAYRVIFPLAHVTSTASFMETSVTVETSVAVTRMADEYWIWSDKKIRGYYYY